ncbi:MAG: YdcF family protein [Lachnospiraceae bacterium]|nr:YdcF family protein [Lachnospiraceae bacterium]
MVKVQLAIVSLIIFVAGLVFDLLYLRKASKGYVIKKFIICVYSPLAIWSVAYYVICLLYAGITLSWIWLWPLIAVFCFLRIIMLRAEIEETPLIRIPKGLRIAYRILFITGLSLFLFVEGRIIGAMSARAPENLDYVIVLGAGLIGESPSNPLRVRIEKAAEYMMENPDTILVASGGKGTDERISEAECIRQQLTWVYGIDNERILIEDKSRDTIENLENSLTIIGDANAYTGVITNGFHEYRAMLIARHAGFENAHSVPATTLLPVGIHYLVREFFGVVQCMVKFGNI